MTPGSNQAASASRNGYGRECCLRCASYKSESISPESAIKDRKNSKPPSFKKRLKFLFQGRLAMEPTVDEQYKEKESHAELTQRSLKELTTKWFVETQTHFIVENGFFPSWFWGFVSRYDAEDILQHEVQGCFLVRLSERVVGYILSYKGSDRCRHFVINQRENGRFVIGGAAERHHTVPDVVNYYKTHPVLPFGEYLTESCVEERTEELYDTITVPERRRLATNRPMKNRQMLQTVYAQTHTRLSDSKSNAAMEIPPLPQRSRDLQSNFLHDKDSILYAQLRKKSPREMPKFQINPLYQLPEEIPEKAKSLCTWDQSVSRCRSPSKPDSLNSELSRGRSAMTFASEGELRYRPTEPPAVPPRPSSKPTKPVESVLPRLEKADLSLKPNGLDPVEENHIYHLACSPCNGGLQAVAEGGTLAMQKHSDSVYDDIHHDDPFSRLPKDNTYEMMPGFKDAVPEFFNVYESLEDE